MAFSSLNPEDIVRTKAALERAWMLVVAKGLARHGDSADRDRMARIVVEFVGEATSEDDLVSVAVRSYASEITF